MPFDIDRYKTLSERLDDSDIDYDRFRTEPLSPEALRCVRYMHDVELHTVCYLRDILVTRSHRDPELTTFLSCWVYEELWHGEALAKVLEAHGESTETRVAELRGRKKLQAALTPLTMQLLSAATPHLGAVQMTWGAINEWTTQAGYARLAQREDHPVLSELLRRIMKQEGRHIDFYVTQAKARLAESSAARRITRWMVRRFWTPVGAGVMPAAEVEHLVSFLFGDDDGAGFAARIDRRVDRLPGLDGLALVTGARHTLAA